MMKGLLLALLLVGAAFGQEGSEQSTRHPDDNLITTTPTSAEAKVALPEPVNISASVGVDSSASGNVPRVEIDTDGIPVLHGVVMPDDPNDKKVWRNARVLNNVLIERNQKSASIDSGSQAIKEQGDMFVYRPESARVLNDGDSFQPSAVDSTAFSPSLPYPAFYYQRFYKDAQEAEKEMPDSLAVETDETENTTDKVEDAANDTDARRINLKKKNTGITKQRLGSAYGKDAPVTGRPIYYVSAEEAKAIHEDRSPYNYEPAQQQPNYYGVDYSAQSAQQPNSKQDVQYYLQQQQQLLLQQQLQQQQQQQQPSDSPNRAGFFPQNTLVSGKVVPAPADSFVIREQTYNNGAGQSFSVPVPVPKDQYKNEYERQYLEQQAQLQYAQQAQLAQQTQQAQQYQQYYGQYPHYLYVGQQNPNKYATQQQPSQQPFEFLGSKLREQVQKARDKLHEVTDPVVDPLMEAGQKISANLGLPDRVNKINEKVATPGVLVPLAMVGGAALALGGLATTIHLTNAESRNQTLKAIGLGNTKIADRLQTLIKVKRSIDEYDVPAPSDELDEGKQNVLDHVLSALNGPQKSFLSQLQRTGFDQWQKTPCAKRIFCDVMVQQNDDSIVLMEKRMSTFLSLLDSGVARNLQALTSDVMDGIRRRNCSAFVCGESASE